MTNTIPTDDIPYPGYSFKTYGWENLPGYHNPAKIDEHTILRAIDRTKENDSPTCTLSMRPISAWGDDSWGIWQKGNINICKGTTAEHPIISDHFFGCFS